MSFIARLFQRHSRMESRQISNVALQHCDPVDIERIESTFKKLSERSHTTDHQHIDRETFLSTYFPNDKEFGLRFFEAFDKRSDGIISLLEFSIGIAILLYGSHKEKIEFLFKTFDVDKDGLLRTSEVKSLLNLSLGAIAHLVDHGYVQNRPITSTTIARLAAEAGAFTENDDGLSLNQFRKWYFCSYDLHLFMEMIEKSLSQDLEEAHVRRFSNVTFDSLSPSMLRLFGLARLHKDDDAIVGDGLCFLLTVLCELLEEVYSLTDTNFEEDGNFLGFDFDSLGEEIEKEIVEYLMAAAESRRFSTFSRLSEQLESDSQTKQQQTSDDSQSQQPIVEQVTTSQSESDNQTPQI